MLIPSPTEVNIKAYFDSLFFIILDSPVGPWGEPGPCSVTCGIGVKTRTRLPKRNLTAEELERFPLHKHSECYADPCPDGKK